jgi:hypothetical protein
LWAEGLRNKTLKGKTLKIDQNRNLQVPWQLSSFRNGFLLTIKMRAGHWWLIPVILAIQEAAIRRIAV